VTIEGMGAPLPGEVVLLTGAAFAAQGHLDIVGVVIASWIGTLLGGTGGYWIGRVGGAPLLARYGHWVGLNPTRVAWAHDYFERHGAKTVLVARFVAVLRMIAGLLAGITRMSFGVFTLANAVGGALWSIAFGALGYIFGRNLPMLESYLRRFSLGAFVLAVIVAIGMWLWRRRRPTP
jgi:membrane protein DedA with SNARE-associated domain